ncbi:MAG: polysaccharide deacetylase [Pseudomonadota bacterium]
MTSLTRRWCVVLGVLVLSAAQAFIPLSQSNQSSAQERVERPPQFVLLSFDGSKDNKFWRESRAFAKKHNIRFTYFISGVYFLTRAERKVYVEPKRGPGRSAIGYGGTPEDIADRLDQLWLAFSEGHEIASHANGHFDGSSYTARMWNSELKQFGSILQRAWAKYSRKKVPEGFTDMFDRSIIGLRAPQLGVSKGLFRALREKNYLYDTSRVNRMNYWPRKRAGVWNFPLASIRLARSKKRTLSMDYNLYFAHSKAKRAPKSKWQAFEDETYETYMNYFRNNYYGNRAPIDIGHHFSKWNGGSYWRGMQRFARAVCNRDEVLCVTYQDLMAFMEANVSKTDAFQAGRFPKKKRGS